MLEACTAGNRRAPGLCLWWSVVWLNSCDRQKDRQTEKMWCDGQTFVIKWQTTVTERRDRYCFVCVQKFLGHSFPYIQLLRTLLVEVLTMLFVAR
jgi:hypothetical protein